MTATTSNGSRKWMGRGMTVAAAGAALLMSMAAAPAHADARQWEIAGPPRATAKQARGDIPATQAECRRQNGQVVSSGWADFFEYYHAVTMCKSD